MPRPQSGTERGLLAGQSTQGPPRTRPKNSKNVSCAAIERPEYPDQPRHSTGGWEGRNEKEHLKPRPQNSENVKGKPRRRPRRPPKLRKTENYRAQRRCKTQLSKAAPRDTSMLHWTPGVNALSVLGGAENIVQLPSKSCSASEKEDASVPVIQKLRHRSHS